MHVGRNPNNLEEHANFHKDSKYSVYTSEFDSETTSHVNKLSSYAYWLVLHSNPDRYFSFYIRYAYGLNYSIGLTIKKTMSTCPLVHMSSCSPYESSCCVSDLCFMENVRWLKQTDKVALPASVRSGVALIGLFSYLPVTYLSIPTHSTQAKEPTANWGHSQYHRCVLVWDQVCSVRALKKENVNKKS